MKYKVEDYSQYVKDSETKAILNTDKRGLMSYKHQRDKFSKTFNAISELEDLKKDVNEIKLLLHELINNKTKD